MGGRGFAPKKPENRQNRTKPARGEWKELPDKPFKGKRPRLPRVTGGLLASTKATWEVWWSSPMAHEWTVAEWPLLTQLIMLEDRINRALQLGDFPSGFVGMMNNSRIMKDSLGLTEKGRRDLRWELPAGYTGAEDDDSPLASVSDISSRQRPDPRRKKK